MGQVGGLSHVRCNVMNHFNLSLWLLLTRRKEFRCTSFLTLNNLGTKGVLNRVWEISHREDLVANRPLFVVGAEMQYIVLILIVVVWWMVDVHVTCWWMTAIGVSNVVCFDGTVVHSRWWRLAAWVVLMVHDFLVWDQQQILVHQKQIFNI